MFSRLGGNIDVILQENYRSVLAAEGMKEALERMDSALLFAIGGEDEQAHAQFAEYRPVFERNLKIEQGNVTLPGEQEMADDLTTLTPATSRLAERVLRPAARAGSAERTRLYFTRAPADLQGDQERGRRGAGPEPEEHGGRERTARAPRPLSTRRDDPGPDRRGGRRHGDRAGA